MPGGLPAYEALFVGASEQHLAVGESSPIYLRCRDAVANILRYNADARFIVMLRNPVEMAYSWHSQLLYGNHENIEDFEAAWNLQDARKAGRRIPRFCLDVEQLFYGEVCSVGEQLRRVYQRVPAERVHVVVFDDLKADPAGAYCAVLNFLKVPDDYSPVFEAHNPAMTRGRWSGLIRRAWPPLRRLRIALGVRKPFALARMVDRHTRKVQPRPPLPPHLRHALSEYFHHDIRLLERLTGRDLAHWRGAQSEDTDG